MFGSHPREGGDPVLRISMKAYLEQFRTWWDARQAQERTLLLVGAALMAVLLFYLAVWQPVARAHHRAELALSQSHAAAQRLEVIGAEVARLRGAGGQSAANRSLSLLAAVDQASRGPELGKAPSRIQPEGDKEVKLWIDDVPFDAVLQWTQLLQSQYGITVSSAEIERKGEGVVSARLSLVRP